MRKAYKYIWSLVGLLAVFCFSVAATMNIDSIYIILKNYIKNPINLSLYTFAVIGFVCFFKKLISDAYQWFSTGLSSDNL